MCIRAANPETIHAHALRSIRWPGHRMHGDMQFTVLEWDIGIPFVKEDIWWNCLVLEREDAFNHAADPRGAFAVPDIWFDLGY
jgi:hypothetical protein